LSAVRNSARYVIPANNGPVPEEVRQARLGDYAGIRERIQQSYFGFELTLLEKGALESTDEEIYQHVDLIGKIIGEVLAREAETIEPTQEAEDAWVVHNAELVKPTLFETADTWYIGANIPGKPRVFMPNLSFVGPYRAKCEEAVANDYEGLVFDANK